MGTMIQTRQRMPAEAVVPGDAAARSGQVCEITVPGGEAANGVQNQVDLDPGARPLGECVDEPLRDFSFLENVGFERDAAARRPDGAQFRFVKNLTVREGLDGA